VRPIHLLKAVAVVLNTAICAPLCTVACLLDRDARLGFRVAQAWVAINIWISGVRVEAVGLDNLDPRRSYIFMSNHRSNADIVAVAWVLWDFQLRWVAKVELLKVPVFGWALRALKNIVIDRTNHRQAVASYAAARERIRRGISVMVFPEGTRGVGDELLPFKKGGFVLAVETETPIVPIAVIGTAAVLPRKGWRVEPGVVEIRIGRPIETAGVPIARKDEIVAKVRASIEELIAGGTPLPAPRAAAERA
jgi:1-acyl-sn-glycerol-3-phosphate acyltransferase